MDAPSPIDPVKLERLPRAAWGIIGVLLLSVLYAILHIGFVRPFLWPAGSGALLGDDPSARVPLLARPPDVRYELNGPLKVLQVGAGAPAAARGVQPGDAVTVMRTTDSSIAIDFGSATRTAEERLIAWRNLYAMGVAGPVQWDVRSPSGGTRTVTVDRQPVWSGGSSDWAGRHLGIVVQMIVFIGGGIVLFLLRSHDTTAGMCVLALALSGVAGGGPLMGAERGLPAGQVLTVFAWMASPFAFPVIALAIFYFPSRSPLLARRPWLHAVPLLAAAPMILPGLLTALYLGGVEGVRGAALWDATHPGVFYGSFAVALGINVLAVVEGTYRYKGIHDANARRRTRMALYTAVPGVLAYALKDGVPVVARLTGVALPPYHPLLYVLLQALVLLPAFGLVYAVGVARVLGPRVVLRRSLQYALANRTLTILTILPGAALIVSLVLNRDRTIAEIARSSSGLFLVLIGAAILAWRYRERARQWLDQRFFREEYDARKILLSLASRVRFETDPTDLAGLVVTELDAALHPQLAAILVTGVEDNVLSPVASLYGDVQPLPLDGGLVAMLRWSDEPLELYLEDPRSPARRLPTVERSWLASTGAVLLVPVLGEDRALVAVIALGERRSEEAYTLEDRQLLASIATQMGLGLDVARLRRRGAGSGVSLTASASTHTGVLPMMECPRCGRCEESSVAVCPSDGSTMRAVPSVPRTVDNKYRLEQMLGRGGMGAVYRARDVRLDRLVAVKVVRAELLGDVAARRRFRREAQIVARLQHRSIVAVYDYGTFPDGGAYLVMELVRGEDLRRVLQREGRMEPEAALRILSSVCDAIDAAHREGVLHRDLKPENILLTGGSGVAKVLDFGVAKVVEEAPREGVDASEAPTLMTAAGMIIGTPAYMAPEQFSGTRLDGRVDVFSLGVIAYEMLSGDLPFGHGSLGEVVLAHSRGVPPMRRGDLSAATQTAIRAALSMDPDRRPASAIAFAHLLASSLGMR
jgi:tRNA A-37 threonylcarbamoyl transferase component Bud32